MRMGMLLSKRGAGLGLGVGFYLSLRKRVSSSARELRCEHLDEVEDVTAQVIAAAHAEMDRIGLEELARVDGAQALVALRVVGELRDDCDAEPLLDGRLDHVGVIALSTICGSGPRPRTTSRAAASERRRVVRDDRILRERLEREPAHPQQRVIAQREHHAVHFIAGEEDEVAAFVRLRAYAHVGSPRRTCSTISAGLPWRIITSTAG